MAEAVTWLCAGLRNIASDHHPTSAIKLVLQFYFARLAASIYLFRTIFLSIHNLNGAMYAKPIRHRGHSDLRNFVFDCEIAMVIAVCGAPCRTRHEAVVLCTGECKHLLGDTGCHFQFSSQLHKDHKRGSDVDRFYSSRRLWHSCFLFERSRCADCVDCVRRRFNCKRCV